MKENLLMKKERLLTKNHSRVRSKNYILKKCIHTAKYKSCIMVPSYHEDAFDRSQNILKEVSYILDEHLTRITLMQESVDDLYFVPATNLLVI